MNKNDLVKTEEVIDLSTSIEELENKLLTENDIDKLNNIINVFNLNIKRKDMVRTSKLNDLQDKITAQIATRLEKNAGEFSNKDLLDYFKVLQDTISKSDNSLKSIDTPAIQINQQQINIGTDKLNRESREKVKNVVSQILMNSGYSIDDLEMIDLDEEEND